VMGCCVVVYPWQVGSEKRGCMSTKVIIAINICILMSGCLVFVLTGRTDAALSTTIGLSLGSFFWLRGRKRK